LWICILLTGSKRKLPESEESIAWWQVADDLLTADLDDAITTVIDDIRSGNHPEALRRGIALEKLKEKQIAHCDLHRKEQIKNINQLFEYEIEDAKALFDVRNSHYLIVTDK
jgi:hypothetical protein